VTIPIPPLAEQRRIVAKIEALQERSRRVREALSEVAPLLEQFRQSVLATAFRGDLTADWRGAHPNIEPASELLQRIRAERRRRWEQAELSKYEARGQKPLKNWQDKYEELEPVDDSDPPELPKGWVWTTWESILSLDDGSFKRGPFGSALKKSIFVSSGYKVYEQYCPINDDCSYVRYYITPEKYEELKAFAVKARDFLISCSGVTLGRITQVPDDFEEGIINQALLRVRINNEIVNDQFFLKLFRSPYFQKQIFDNATGSAIPNVKGVKDLKAIPVPVPPLAEQLEVLERLKERLDYIRGIEEDVKVSNVAFDHLNQSILAKAFRGELVPQDPSDEPASMLLERIRVQRTQQAESTKQTSKTPRRSALTKKLSKLAPQQLTLAEVLTTQEL
jgi:type I restriction enzyme S subunit